MYDEILFPQLVSAKCIAFHYKTSKYNTKVKSDDKYHICRAVFTGLYLIKLTTNQGDISKLCLCLFVCFLCRELLRFWKFSAISVNSETHGGHFMAGWRSWKSKGQGPIYCATSMPESPANKIKIIEKSNTHL